MRTETTALSCVPPQAGHKRRYYSPRQAGAAMRVDTIWENARLATLAGGLGLVEDGFVAAGSGRIVYAGPASEAPSFDTAKRINCDGRWITPGLIDCHTHLVYGGDRAREFEMRLAG